MTVTLPLLRLEIAHQDGVDVFDPNGLIVKIAGSSDLEAEWKPLGWEGTHVRSVLSARPAVVYRSGDKQIPLTVSELRRLVLSALRPPEVLALLEVFGDFFEIHDDFYDHGTGQALQPKA